LVLQEPRMAPYRSRIRRSLAQAMGINAADVSLRATTTEKMGFTGRGEGIAALAVSLLECEVVRGLDL